MTDAGHFVAISLLNAKALVEDRTKAKARPAITATCTVSGRGRTPWPRCLKTGTAQSRSLVMKGAAKLVSLIELHKAPAGWMPAGNRREHLRTPPL